MNTLHVTYFRYTSYTIKLCIATISGVLLMACVSNETLNSGDGLSPIQQEQDINMSSREPAATRSENIVLRIDLEQENLHSVRISDTQTVEPSVNDETNTATTTEVVKTKPEIIRLHFQTDDYSIKQDDYELLWKHAKYLTDHPDTVLNINGHADKRGTEEYNQTLSEKRAATVREILLSYGVNPSQLYVRAFGESQPLNSEGNLDENRRVQLDYVESFLLGSVE